MSWVKLQAEKLSCQGWAQGWAAVPAVRHRLGLARMSRLMKPTYSCPRKGLKSSWLGPSPACFVGGWYISEGLEVSRGSSVTRIAAGRRNAQSAYILGVNQMQGTPGTCLHLGKPHPELCLPVPWSPGSGLPLLSLWPCSNFATYSQEARKPGSGAQQCHTLTC